MDPEPQLQRSSSPARRNRRSRLGRPVPAARVARTAGSTFPTPRRARRWSTAMIIASRDAVDRRARGRRRGAREGGSIGHRRRGGHQVVRDLTALGLSRLHSPRRLEQIGSVSQDPATRPSAQTRTPSGRGGPRAGRSGRASGPSGPSASRSRSAATDRVHDGDRHVARSTAVEGEGGRVVHPPGRVTRLRPCLRATQAPRQPTALGTRGRAPDASISNRSRLRRRGPVDPAGSGRRRRRGDPLG